MWNTICVNFAVFLIAVAIFYPGVSAIHCYQCTSQDSPDCASSSIELLNGFLIDCANLQGSHCVKSVGPTNKITRGCSASSPATPGMECKSHEGAVVCSCDTEYCNGSFRTIPSYSSIFSSLALAICAASGRFVMWL